ncbi:hypothetical protein [Paenibacillus naphthalenovorans]|uniref:hypothetical protein n=1 Tax=Paenibacillus naphthalenovorans TaxID=162209 RepID=UPI003D286EFC
MIDVQNGFCTRLIKDSQLQIMKPGNEHDKSLANRAQDQQQPNRLLFYVLSRKNTTLLTGKRHSVISV